MSITSCSTLREPVGGAQTPASTVPLALPEWSVPLVRQPFHGSPRLRLDDTVARHPTTNDNDQQADAGVSDLNSSKLGNKLYSEYVFTVLLVIVIALGVVCIITLGFIVYKCRKRASHRHNNGARYASTPANAKRLNEPSSKPKPPKRALFIRKYRFTLFIQLHVHTNGTIV
jgi:hypothetical protein